MKKIWLDSETRSPVDLKKHGMYRYTNNCEPIVITYAFDDKPVQIWQIGEELDPELLKAISEGVEVYAHNAMFDYLALREILGLKLEQMVDTMAYCSANHLPANLDEAGEVLGITEKKLKTGKALIRHFCIPKKDGTYNSKEANLEKWEDFINYAVTDVEAMRQITKLLRPLSEYEQGIWLFTQKMNLRGVPINLESTKNFITLGAKTKEKLNAELELLTGIKSASQTKALIEWLNSEGIEVTSIAKDIIGGLLRGDLDPKVRRVLEIRKQASMTSTKKFDVFLDTHIEGRILGAYMYHGANTGRYASRGGLNLQNIPRGSESDAVTAYHNIKNLDFDSYEILYGLEIEPLSSVVRPTIEAPKGKKFVDYDFSSIENRVAPWVGGETKHLELFRNGLDEYKDFATVIYEVEYSKVTKEMRQISKSAILGSIFGAGAKGLQGYYAQFGVEIELDYAQKLVDIYRAKHKGIAKAWKAFGNKAKLAIENRGTAYKTNKCIIKASKNFLVLKLPSGRVIQWYSPKIEPVKAPWGDMIDSVTVVMKMRMGHKFIRQQLIGSSIFQSVVQATARDLLINSMLNLENAGYDLVMTTHDEVVAEVDESWDNHEEFIELMTTNPDWCKEVPLAVEGWEDKNYQK